MTIKGLNLLVKDEVGCIKVQSQVTRADSKRSLEDTLRLVLGGVDHAGISADISSDSAHKRPVISNWACSFLAEESEIQGFTRSTPADHVPCDLDDDL